MRKCFNNLDVDGSGSIGVDEIKLPLIGLGLVESIEEVEEMVAKVDSDNSGEIEFNEFLKIIKGFGGEKAGNLTEFLQKLTSR